MTSSWRGSTRTGLEQLRPEFRMLHSEIGRPRCSNSRYAASTHGRDVIFIVFVPLHPVLGWHEKFGFSPSGSVMTVKAKMMTLLAAALIGIVALSATALYQLFKVYDSASFAAVNSLPSILALDTAQA